MLIEDLTWTADAPLAAPEARIGDLCEGLLDLEEILVAQIGEVHSQDHRRTNALLDTIRQDPEETLERILTAAAAHRDAVTTPRSFRPSLRDGRALTARLWRVVQERESDRLKRPSRGLADALALPDRIELAWHESIFSVLRRPRRGGGKAAPRLRFARNVYLTVGTACQLITAAAHADDYSQYPVILLRSVAYDLRRSLADAETAVAGHGIDGAG